MADDQLSSTASLDSDISHGLHSEHPQPIQPERTREQEYVEKKDGKSNGNLDRQQSNASSGKLKKVPVGEKRGLFAKFAIIPEYEDARDYPKSYKLTIVFVIAFAAITGPMGTSIMLPAIDDVVKDLDTTGTIVNVSVGMYLLSLGIFPMWWSTFSEKHGRRSVYLISFILFCVFTIGAALSPNIGALIAFRILSGGCSASVQAVGAGTVGDLYINEERGTAMGLYYLGPLMGPFLAPIIGGAVAEAWGWRATQWLLVIFSGSNVLSIMFLLPETIRRQDSDSAIKEMLRQYHKVEESEEGDQELTTGVPIAVDDIHGEGNQVEALEAQDVEGKQDDSELAQLAVILDVPTRETNIHYSDADLARIASSLSRSGSRQSLDWEQDRPVFDPVMPTLARSYTDKSSYSRRIAKEYRESQIDNINKTLSGAAQDTELPIKKLSKWDRFKINAYDYTIRPMHSVILLKHPPVAWVISYSAIVFGVLYFFNMTIAYEFKQEPYEFLTIIVGLLYIPNSVTYVIASILGGKWNDYLLKKYSKKHNGEMVPESRISWNVLTAIILFPPACLIFGWCLDFGTHWVTPLIGTALFGFASMLVIGSTVTYLVDTLPGKGATGVALNNLIRQTLAAIATFVVEPLLRAIGPGILFSILMGIITLAALTLVVLKRNGAFYREHSDLSKLYEML
ncbi:uncharacterized protein AC631_00930 [Debaryomyces fabryi]|uniref:Major facilitator superfamily (MFS) profile domain-containing protein n=1 Tax=Debaryomyces fabryi TaxID=58627 RepID=A0A0V1Q4D8_9ASCO|nr:uncharacterized protein AC631_00930 [Debaryomyces fabryi]KSA03292.1 hypothetical protein AC631_00930 [Debaryomyces fabryi]CUM45115.1 unnamed protein product [Debaryomyces fabryi]